MDEHSPEILVIAGPNGSGKSTCAATYLPEGMPFLNADDVAKDLAGYPSPYVDMQAGRIVLEQMEVHETKGESFAVETTLASRSLASRITRLRMSGYRFHLVFVWSPNSDFSVLRVASRVRAGGHHIPEETIRRRYSAGLKNFFSLYRPLADVWDVLDNTGIGGPVVIAAGRMGLEPVIHLAGSWEEMLKGGNDEPE